MKLTHNKLKQIINEVMNEALSKTGIANKATMDAFGSPDQYTNWKALQKNDSRQANAIEDTILSNQMIRSDLMQVIRDYQLKPIMNYNGDRPEPLQGQVGFYRKVYPSKKYALEEDIPKNITREMFIVIDTYIFDNGGKTGVKQFIKYELWLEQTTKKRNKNQTYAWHAKNKDIKEEFEFELNISPKKRNLAREVFSYFSSPDLVESLTNKLEEIEANQL